MNLEYPTWQKPLAAAILEFNPSELRDKLRCAEEAINNRMQELRSAAKSEHEVRSLFDGLSIIRGLRRDRLDCGKAEFTVRDDALVSLQEGQATNRKLCTGFDVFELQKDGSEHWVDSVGSFAGAVFQAKLAGIQSPGKYVITSQSDGERQIINLSGETESAQRNTST